MDWMNDNQKECYRMLCDLFGGAHHLSNPERRVKPYSSSGIEYSDYGSRWATWDFAYLTRAVFMAHDRCIRFEIGPSGPGLVRLMFHKRSGREGEVWDRHPTLEEAIDKFTGKLNVPKY